MNSKSSSWKCGLCNQEHEEFPLDVAYLKPQHYFEIPPGEVADRVRINEDICVIDDQIFLIRGFLPLPIIESGQVFGWGVWALTERENFERYFQLFEEDASREQPFRGFLSATMPPYPNTHLLPVSIQLAAAKDRPIFTVIPKDHPLYEEQTSGITLARAHEIVRICLPNLFQNGA